MEEYFAMNGKRFAETICKWNCIDLCAYITLSCTSNANIVEWLVSIPAVQVFVDSPLIIYFGSA